MIVDFIRARSKMFASKWDHLKWERIEIMSQTMHPLSRWLRSRQLLTDSGYGVANPSTYPFFAIEKMGPEIFSLSVIMPPCADEQLSINLEGADLIITATAKDDPAQISCEHHFKLSAPCTIAGANWDRGNLFMELICLEADSLKSPNQLVSKYHGHGQWLMEQQKSGASITRAA